MTGFCVSPLSGRWNVTVAMLWAPLVQYEEKGDGNVPKRVFLLSHAEENCNCRQIYRQIVASPCDSGRCRMVICLVRCGGDDHRWMYCSFPARGSPLEVFHLFWGRMALKTGGMQTLAATTAAEGNRRGIPKEEHRGRDISMPGAHGEEMQVSRADSWMSRFLSESPRMEEANLWRLPFSSPFRLHMFSPSIWENFQLRLNCDSGVKMHPSNFSNYPHPFSLKSCLLLGFTIMSNVLDAIPITPI